MSILNMLDLSTKHVKGPKRAWGCLRVATHAYGWVVFVDPDLDTSASNTEKVLPEWIRPAYKMAQEHHCVLINFDRDGDVEEQALPVWEW
ncbi:MAG: hypothetical protein Q8Q52_01105 [Acidimicrobiia bacterium]|nr:hypothetical protein [Acidimicrobiia bacterium]